MTAGTGQLGRFLLLTFALSWGPWLLLVLRGGPLVGLNTALQAGGACGPLLAALLLWWRDRPPDRRNPFGPRPAGLTWVGVAVVAGALPAVVAAAVSAVAGAAALDPRTAYAVVGSTGGPLGFLVVYLIAGPLSEEPGWRGYAQPRLAARLTPVRLAVLLGAVWAVWHLPLFAVEGTSQHRMGLLTGAAGFFLLACVPQTYLLGAVYGRFRGGVAGAVLTHFLINAVGTLLDVRGALAWGAVLGTSLVLAAALHRTADRRHRGTAGHGRVGSR